MRQFAGKAGSRARHDRRHTARSLAYRSNWQPTARTAYCPVAGCSGATTRTRHEQHATRALLDEWLMTVLA